MSAYSAGHNFVVIYSTSRCGSQKKQSIASRRTEVSLGECHVIIRDALYGAMRGDGGPPPPPEAVAPAARPASADGVRFKAPLHKKFNEAQMGCPSYGDLNIPPTECSRSGFVAGTKREAPAKDFRCLQRRRPPARPGFRPTAPFLESFQAGSGQTGSSQKCRTSP